MSIGGAKGDVVKKGLGDNGGGYLLWVVLMRVINMGMTLEMRGLEWLSLGGYRVSFEGDGVEGGERRWVVWVVLEYDEGV